MAASFTLVLDTTPPQITFGTPVIREGESLTVDFSITEPSPAEAWLQIGSVERPGVLLGSKAVFDLSDLAEWPGGKVRIVTLDDVGNAGEGLLLLAPPSFEPIIEESWRAYPDSAQKCRLTDTGWRDDYVRTAGIANFPRR